MLVGKNVWMHQLSLNVTRFRLGLRIIVLEYDVW
jgi:hypothetical protein